MQNSEKKCPDDETLLTFMEGRSGLETGARVLSHVQHCDQCKAVLAFVCSAAALDKRGELPELTSADREKCRESAKRLLAEAPGKGISFLWTDVLDKLRRLCEVPFETEAIAAGIAERKLVFCSLLPKRSAFFWCATVEMPECVSDDAVICIELLDAKGGAISRGVLTFCGIRVPIAGDKGEIPLAEFRRNLGTGGIVFTWEGGNSSEGIPVLGTIR